MRILPSDEKYPYRTLGKNCLILVAKYSRVYRISDFWKSSDMDIRIFVYPDIRNFQISISEFYGYPIFSDKQCKCCFIAAHIVSWVPFCVETHGAERSDFHVCLNLLEG